MLKQNKSLIAKAAIFLAILIVGGYFLFTSRDREYIPTPTPTPTPQPPPEVEPLVRRPIVTSQGMVICRCPSHSHALLSYARPRHQRVDPKKIVPTSFAAFLLEADGTLWGWGSNWGGQLGTGTWASHSLPTEILTDVIYVAQGGHYAIRLDNSLWVWGREGHYVEGGEWHHWHYLPAPPRFLMNDVASVFQHENGDFALGTDNTLWSLGTSTTPWNGLVVPDTSDTAHVMSCVQDFQFVGSDLIVLQCSGHLWRVKNDQVVLLMEEVVSFHPSMAGAVGGILVLQSDNSLWAVNATQLNAYPEHILDDVAYVARGIDLSNFAIQNNGNLWAWGSNSHSQLGTGLLWPVRSAPARVMGNVASIHPFGTNGTFAITTEGELWGWGPNMQGQLGTGTAESMLYPVHIKDNVRYVTAMNDTTFAIDTNNNLWTWGATIFDTNVTFLQPAGQVTPLVSNRFEPFFVMENVAEITVLAYNVIIICTQDNLYMYGRGWEATPLAHHPRLALDNVVQVTATGRAGFALRGDNSLWAFGSSWPAGGLGDGTERSRDYPVNISYGFSYIHGHPPAPLGATTVEVTLRELPQLPLLRSFDGTIFFIDQASRLWSWGLGWSYRLGRPIDRSAVGNPFHDSTPAVVMDNVVDVGFWPLSLTRSDGSIWIWGDPHGPIPTLWEDAASPIQALQPWENYMLTADGDLLRRSHEFTHISYPDVADETTILMTDVRSIYRFGNVFFVIENNGNLWTWGFDTTGMLGHGAPPENYVPWTHIHEYREMILPNVVSLINQGSSMYAIQANGHLWAWGENKQGQLGDGSRRDRFAPVFIMGGVQALHTQGTSVMAIRADNNLWAWGTNNLGQLGDGAYLSRTRPIPIMEAPRQLFMFGSTIYAIMDDSSLWAWGDGYGANPVHIMADASALHRDHQGRIYAIGGGNLWDIGGQDVTFVMADVAVMFPSHWMTFVVTTSGELWGWGNNWQGELGVEEYYVPRGDPVRILFEG